MEKCFSLECSWEIYAPENYDHRSQLLRVGIDVSIARAFSNVSYKISPGEGFFVDLYKFKKNGEDTDSFERFISFIKRESGIFVGAQGLSLLGQQKKSELPSLGYVFSVDQIEVVQKGFGENIRFPALYKNDRGNLELVLFPTISLKDIEVYLVCFRIMGNFAA